MDRRHFLVSLPVLLAGAASIASAIAAVDETKPLAISWMESYRPLSYVENGRVRGALVEILDEVLVRRLRQTLDHAGFPWKRAQETVQRGERDALCTVPTAERLKYCLASREPVFSLPMRIFVRADNPLLPRLQHVRNVEDLRILNPSILSFSGNGWVSERLKDFNVDAKGDFEASMRMLVAGRGDIIVLSATTAQQWLNDPKHPGTKDIRMMPHVLDEIHCHLLINRNSPHRSLLPVFDKAMAKFRHEPGYQAILRNHGIQS